jgi:polyhydroxybutyrate depolymerase
VVTTVVLSALVYVAACSGDDAGSAAPASSGDDTASTPATTIAAAKPCTPGAGYTAGTTTHDLAVAGVTRQFLAHLPPEPTADMALVVDFHGAGSNMTQQAVYSGFDALADENDFVVATPNGVDAAIRQWRFLGEEDVGFATALVDDLVAHSCVDPARVFAVGMSSGAAMSAGLACRASDTFAGFGLVAADFYIPAICADATPNPMVIFHGTSDAVVPYAGGSAAGSRVPVRNAEQTAQAWATHNGCAGGPRETTVDTEVVRLDWDGCTEPVVMYRIVGGGHTWPGAIDVARLGPTTDQIRASDVMLETFGVTDPN